MISAMGVGAATMRLRPPDTVLSLSSQSFVASLTKAEGYMRNYLLRQRILTCVQSDSFVLAEELQPWR
jgi:hypothetical protein